MATADHIKALVKSHANGDEERFYAIAIQVAAGAARQGHTKFAKDLRDLVDQAKARGHRVEAGVKTKPIPIVQPKGELSGLLTASFPSIRLSDMALDTAISKRLERILVEQRQRENLRSHGMSPIRKSLGRVQRRAMAWISRRVGSRLRYGLGRLCDGFSAVFVGERRRRTA